MRTRTINLDRPFGSVSNKKLTDFIRIQSDHLTQTTDERVRVKIVEILEELHEERNLRRKRV